MKHIFYSGVAAVALMGASAALADGHMDRTGWP